MQDPKLRAILPGSMTRWLPIVYASILLLEAIWLTWRFSTDPPDSAHPFSVGLGWAGVISMIVMQVYSFARRSTRLRRIAPLKSWLHFHIFCGLQGVLFVFFHCWPMLFARTGPVHWLNPGVLNALAVAMVFFSGLFGRYLYSMLPRARRGEQLAALDVREELQRQPLETLPLEVRQLCRFESDQPPEYGGGVLSLLKTDWQTRKHLRTLRSLELPDGIRDLAERHVRLSRRLHALAVAQPWFELWIVAHRPVAAIMFVLTAVHIILSYMFRAA